MSDSRASQSTVSGPDEIRQLARTFQYDRYVAALLLPRQHREALIVLAAFAAELQRIPFIVSEPMMAAIRFQWWRDQLLATSGPSAGEQRSGHQLCDALVAVARNYNLPFGLLQGIIDAAETENDPTPFAEAAETQQILVKFDGALFELAGRVLGVDVPRGVWSEAATAYGGARLAAEYAWRKSIGAQTYTSRQCADENDAFVKPAREAMVAVRARRVEMGKAAKGALLPLATVEPVLRRVATQSQQTDATKRPLSDFARARTILWAHWRGLI
ncbi:MAG: phytoene synthase [Hyphomicrobiaceae bacterium]|jgi:phytoene synthase